MERIGEGKKSAYNKCLHSRQKGFPTVFPILPIFFPSLYFIARKKEKKKGGSLPEEGRLMMLTELSYQAHGEGFSKGLTRK